MSLPMIANVKDMPLYSVSVGHFILMKGYVAITDVAAPTAYCSFNDPHPMYSGSYTNYLMSTISAACLSAVGNFVRAT